MVCLLKEVWDTAPVTRCVDNFTVRLANQEIGVEMVMEINR
jgi:hypothetical protein